MRLIQFSSQNGSSPAGNSIRPFQIELNSIFYNGEENSDLLGKYDFLSVVFRVDGKNQTFGKEGPEQPGKSKGRNTLTIDYVISESVWQSMPPNLFGRYVSKAVHDCFEKLIEHLQETNETKDTKELQKIFFSGMVNFNEFVKNV